MKNPCATTNYLHNNEDGCEDRCKADPCQNSKLSESPDTSNGSSANSGNHCPDDSAGLAVGENLQALSQADEAGTGGQSTNFVRGIAKACFGINLHPSQ